MKNQPVKKFNAVIEEMDSSLTLDLKSPAGKEKVRDILAERYIRNYPRAIDEMALASGSLLSHMYELGHRGQPRYRLFSMKRANRGVSVVMRTAKMQVPLSKAQQTPGKRRNGREVKVTKRYKFPARPFVFEFGKPVVIKKKADTKVMWTFTTWPTPPQQGPVKILHKRFAGKFRAATNEYFAGEGRMIMSDSMRKYSRAAGQRAARMAATIR